ncbi:MAG TPA: hypothetical protein PLH02_02300 [Bacillota bacterium]|nr:hypothetical protein [Bacillota bacterium]HPF42160.1 hypothetical protein [Bacillota bacterium]HPJ85664.1 hypothetical protein [Bacillota bacterium]HPQ61699.1 hypothetical protein [Bacillota bacterium]
MKKVMLATTMAFALIAGLFLVGCDQATATDELSYATIEINPAVDLVLMNNTVQTATALNSDGEMLLTQLSLNGLSAEDAVNDIIDEAIDLGYIDPETEGVTVQVSCTNEGTQTMLQEKINTAFQERGMFGRAVAAQNADYIAEAEELGVSAGFLRLVYRAMEADDTLLKEDALVMSTQDLIAIVKDNNGNVNGLSQELKDEFFAARDDLRDEYLPQIQDLQAQITAAEADGLDTTDLQAQLDALVAEFHDELALLRADYQLEGAALKAQVQSEIQARIQAHQSDVQAYRAQIRERIRTYKDEIKAYQNGSTTQTTTTTTATSGEENTNQNSTSDGGSN